MGAVRVFQPRKTAMQSGRAGTRTWVVEFEPGEAPVVDPLMGWTGRGDTRNQLRMTFDSREDAVAFCERADLEYQVIEPKVRAVRPKSYADNFRFDRGSNWTH